MERDSQYHQLSKADVDENNRHHTHSQRRHKRLGRVLLACLSTVAVSLYFYSSSRRFPFASYASSQHTPELLDTATWDSRIPLEQCTQPLAPTAKPPAPINLWASLTVSESTTIQAWLEKPERGLNLTRVSSSSNSFKSPSSLAHNSIFIIEAYRPSKAEALAYLDSSDPYKEAPPKRYARVTIHHGAEMPTPVIRDYLVGPIPVGKETELKPLKEIYHAENGEIPWNARGFLDGNDFNMLWNNETDELIEVMKELFNATFGGPEGDSLVAGGSGPFSFDGSFRRLWLSWRRNVPGPWLHPLNFFQYIDISGTDPAQWKILKIVYNWQVFQGTLIRNPPLESSSSNHNWTQRTRTGLVRDLDHLPGPRSVSFAGLRFRVDLPTQFVSWMGWSFYLSFDRDMGLSLFDIRFLFDSSSSNKSNHTQPGGRRIIYELSPQEALAQYAGNDPMQTTTAWLDRFFGMGGGARDLLEYYDCPAEAVYLPVETRSPTGTIRRERAICVFESDSGRPITRHTGWMEGEFGATKGYVLTVRSISTVGNYDYNGTIEVRVSASGYLQGGFWEPKQKGYGGRIRDSTMGNLHDHVINFKVDFDIAGTSNSLLETTTSQETVTQPWFDEDWGNEVIQQKIHKRFIENENEALLKYPRNFQGGYAIVNQEERNSWGYPRGYAIHPGYSPVHNTVIGSKRLLNNADWARYNLAVSQRKDTEPSSSSMWNMNLPGKPVVDFHKFFDGENITQKDLVAWPQAEDSPNTKTNIAMSSFILTPLNYFDSDISMQSSNAILLSVPQNPEDPFTFDDYGVQQDFSCIPEPLKPFEYSTVQLFDLDGKKVSGDARSMEDLRKMAELFHRVKIEH
ncbi:hypothetical protein D9758_004498 [Tetrapyrgos nigripes]|uniref:Amine oxidase n=1 Tax=Tetrapyrgos nigripes TaxID=182062 RepID=A0A8H5LSL0_9AGAR|nr:hypothetical protein D9758_004498 [Tetrapyrgos nigripes]